MNVKPLTQKEKAWIKRAQLLFSEAPERFDFMTIGDCNFDVIDSEGAKVSELADGQAHRDGIVFAQVNTKGLFHGASG
jgi:hypothetical protein